MLDVALPIASQSLRSLAALSGSLTDPLGPEDAAALVQHQALAALEATSAVVMTLGAYPPPSATADATRAPRLRMLHAIGVPAAVQLELEQVPLDAPGPLAEVARTGRPIFLEGTIAMLAYPEWGGTMTATGARAAAIVPVWANGQLRGVLALGWSEPRIFGDDERAFVLILGVMCAQALLRAHERMEERSAREAAELANRSKAHFLRTISHELRTPMHAVLGYAELIGAEVYGPVSALQHDHLSRMRSSGAHMLSLIDDLLDQARIDASEDVVRPESVMLADLLEQSLRLVRPIGERKGVHVRVEPLATPVELYTDARKTRQILVNLVANAIKFTDAGDVVVDVEVETAGEERYVRFAVTDTGRGIAAADHEHVFESFWRGEHTPDDAVGSTGLGLPLSRQLARLLGGDITIARSEPGRGSTFVAWLPVRYPHARNTARMAATILRSSPSP